MGNFFAQTLGRMLDTGGLLRVRAVLVQSLTGIGGAFLLINETMPPDVFNVMWAASLAYYFGTRGASGGSNG